MYGRMVLSGIMWPCQTPCLWSCHVQENTWKYLPIMVVVAGFLGWHWYQESRSRKSAQDDKWSFCLTAGTLCPSYQERP